MGISYGSRNAAAWTPKNTSVSSLGFFPSPLLPDRNCHCPSPSCHLAVLINPGQGLQEGTACLPSLWTQGGEKFWGAPGASPHLSWSWPPPGHTTEITSASGQHVSVVDQEYTPPTVLTNYGEGKKWWFQSWVTLQKEGEIRAVAEEYPVPSSR